MWKLQNHYLLHWHPPKVSRSGRKDMSSIVIMLCNFKEDSGGSLLAPNTLAERLQLLFRCPAISQGTRDRRRVGPYRHVIAPKWTALLLPLPGREYFSSSSGREIVRGDSGGCLLAPDTPAECLQLQFQLSCEKKTTSVTCDLQAPYINSSWEKPKEKKV